MKDWTLVLAPEHNQPFKVMDYWSGPPRWIVMRSEVHAKLSAQLCKGQVFRHGRASPGGFDFNTATFLRGSMTEVKHQQWHVGLSSASSHTFWIWDFLKHSLFTPVPSESCQASGWWTQGKREEQHLHVTQRWTSTCTPTQNTTRRTPGGGHFPQPGTWKDESSVCGSFWDTAATLKVTLHSNSHKKHFCQMLSCGKSSEWFFL